MGSVLLQRLGFSVGGGQIHLTVPFTLVVLAIGMRTGEFRIVGAKLRAVAVMWFAAGVCTLLQVAVGFTPSLLSLGFVIVLYAMLAFSARLSPAAVASVERVFLGMMAGFAVVSVLQMLVQFLGVPYEDLLQRVVPESLLLNEYHTADPIAYGESLRRSNGVLFLEPSFLSMYLGLAVALAVYRRRGWVLVTVLLVGLVPPLGGSGVVVAVPALALLALTSGRRALLTILPALAVAVLVATVTPLGERYIERSTEATDSRTSSSFRLIQPYSALLGPSVDGPLVAAVGHGAGSANDYLIAVGTPEVTQPIVPKVVFEYGMVGALGILMVLLVTLGKGVRARPWTAGLLLLYLYVNASFLESTTVFMTLFWISLLPAVSADHQSRR
ncbi:hypothetical protein [Blastococcus sp. TF02A-26]|uniref:hypothetical protein n=1 Tax=Blastococcus sp. TF02A-26 TaxID=2250577 RepID=UPI000DE94631|nr:hypothetical protein [Blastococcus sp. TF02A-26]RBY87378.1 hypothetical protein DQ240_07245 [Blastococcus sp. TF02A-26]